MVHNQICGNFDSITPAELFHNYTFTWRSEHTRPQPVIVELQYNWKARYAGHINKVSGFTATGQNRAYVRAFRFTCVPGQGRMCQMEIKGCPSDPNWYGVNSVPNTPGFIVLKRMPRDFPEMKQGTGYKIPHEYLGRICGEAFRNYAQIRGKSVMFDNLVRMAHSLDVPSRGEVDTTTWNSFTLSRRRSMQGYGTVELIGEPECVSYYVPFIRAPRGEMTDTRFWAVAGDAWTAQTAPQYPPPTPPLVRYTRDVERERRQQKRNRGPVDDGADDGEEEKASVPQEPTPNDWGVQMEELKVGRFVVVESLFDPDSEDEEGEAKHGIAVTKVLSICFTSF